MVFQLCRGESWLLDGLEQPGQKYVSKRTGYDVYTFEKCGISVPIDGSRDDQINIQGLSNYTVREESSMENDDEGLLELDSSAEEDWVIYA